MKKIFTFLFLVSSTGFAFAQTVDYGLHYDEANCRYEAYAVANANIKPSQSSGSVYTIVLPGAASDSAITNLTSLSPSASAWSLTDQAYTSGGDYYKIESNSTAAFGKVNAGDTLTLFHFEISNSVCVNVRAWASADPTDPLTQGDDYSNVFSIRGSNLYNSNVSSTINMVDPIISYMVPNCVGTTHGINAAASTQTRAASCGAGSVSYSWTGPNSFTASTINITVVDDPASIGTYTLTVTDEFGCETNNSLTLDSSNCFTAPVPVTLISFKGNKVDNTNVLEWSTATEINNSHFEIQRSLNGGPFEYIGTVETNATNGNSIGTLNYTFTDFSPKTSNQDALYMLKQVDFDNTIEFFGPIRIGAKDLLNNVSIYPIPANNTITVAGLNNEEIYEVAIQDVLGKTILSSSLNKHNNKVDIATIENGIYTVLITSSNGVQSSSKVIISH